MVPCAVTCVEAFDGEFGVMGGPVKQFSFIASSTFNGPSERAWEWVVKKQKERVMD